MIINVRGTSGSGKSTVVRKIIDLFPRKCAIKVPNRKRPLCYVLNRDEANYRPLLVVGHYETPCGGCDTILSINAAYDIVREGHSKGLDVLFEGLLLSADIRRTQALFDDGMPIKVIGMDVSLEECIASVNGRRWRKNPDRPPVNVKNTYSKWKATQRTMEVLTESGLDCHWADRDKAVVLIKEWLEL